MTENVPPDPKEILHRYLRRQRDHLLAKLDGLGERDVRWPMTPTGTNLLGLIKHFASVQLGYFGEVFGRPVNREFPWMDEGSEINADMWATAEETRDEIINLYQFSCAHADETIETLDIDSPGMVPWWPPERRQVNLHMILVHVTVEVARHAGHADIIREMIDGAAGNNDGNLPELTPEEWSAYRSRLEGAATEAAARTP
ncbi:MAG TPA: DinB family protein [Acidimicrobiia bacterium]|nr:DinB family protein [Acidimicrobiia bacterium]